MAATSPLSISMSSTPLLPRSPRLLNPISSSSSSSSSSKPSSSPLSSYPSLPSLSNAGSFASVPASRRRLIELGIGLLPFYAPIPDANATRTLYYATVEEPPCDLNFVKSGLGFCELVVGKGAEAPGGELINVHYTARFADGTVFDSTYKRGRPLTMRIGRGKVLPGLDQGILGGGGVPTMHVGGKRKLFIPPKLAYGPEPAGCFSVTASSTIPEKGILLMKERMEDMERGFSEDVWSFPERIHHLEKDNKYFADKIFAMSTKIRYLRRKVPATEDMPTVRVEAGPVKAGTEVYGARIKSDVEWLHQVVYHINQGLSQVYSSVTQLTDGLAHNGEE